MTALELKALMLATQRGDAVNYRALVAELVRRLCAYCKRREAGGEEVARSKRSAGSSMKRPSAKMSSIACFALRYHDSVIT
jgi:hypothetical protein